MIDYPMNNKKSASNTMINIILDWWLVENQKTLLHSSDSQSSIHISRLIACFFFSTNQTHYLLSRSISGMWVDRWLIVNLEDVFRVEYESSIVMHFCLKWYSYQLYIHFSRNEKKCYTVSKVHHDSPIEGIKSWNLYKQIELNELYRINFISLYFHVWISS